MKTKVLGIALMIAALCGFGVSAQESCCKESKESAANCSKKARPQHPDFFQGITLTADQQAKIDALNAECAKEAKAAKCEKAAKADCGKADTAKCCKAAKCGKAAKCEKAAKADCCKADTAKCGKAAKCDKAAKCEKAAKADCCKADTAKCGNHNKKGMRRVARFHKEKHMEYIGKVKEILTPEQYEVFLKNVESAAPKCKEGKTCQKAEGKCGKAEGKACKEGKACHKAEGKCAKAEKAGCCKDGDNSSKCDKACSKKDAK